MSRSRSVFLVLVVVLILPVSAWATPITIDFDSLAELDAVTNQFAGVTFTNATVLTAGSLLNDLELPPHSGQNVVFDDGAPILMTFTAPIFSFSGFFTYFEPVTVTAYDSANNALANAVSLFSTNDALFGDTGSSANELLAVSSLTGISSVTIAGNPAGSSFVLDDVTFDTSPMAPTPVPEPATLVLLATGIATRLAATRRRARRSRC